MKKDPNQPTLLIHTVFEKSTTWYDNLFNFLLGFVGFNILGFVLGLLLQTTSLNEYQKNMALNFGAYSIMFVIFLAYYLYRRNGFKAILYGFRHFRSIFLAIGIFVIAFFISSIYSLIISSVVKDLSVNANQQAVQDSVLLFPVPSFIMVVLFGPLCEELTYRGGLQTLIARKNKVVAVIVTSLFFAFIHFNWDSVLGLLVQAEGYTINQVYIELLNIPDYIIAGLGLGFAYQISGNLSGSMAAHILNNLLSYILIFVGA